MPYERPPLAKDFLLGKVTENDLILRDEAFFEHKKIDILLGARVAKVDRSARRIKPHGGTDEAIDESFDPKSLAKTIEKAGNLESAPLKPTLSDITDHQKFTQTAIECGDLRLCEAAFFRDRPDTICDFRNPAVGGR